MSDKTRFADRSEAGQALARALEHLDDVERVIVYGLPRGGVPVAYEVARALAAPLEVQVVRKLGVPGQPELAMGAVASGDVTILDESLIRTLGIDSPEVDAVVAEQRAVVRRLRKRLGGADEAPDPAGATVVLVDDGMATGSTMRAAVMALRQRAPGRVVVAVPVASGPACRDLTEVADAVVCLSTPHPFVAVGAWYENFDQVQEREVVEMLTSARNRGA